MAPRRKALCLLRGHLRGAYLELGVVVSGVMTAPAGRDVDDAALRRVSLSTKATILILTAPTGSGHDSAAVALKEALRVAQPDACVHIWNPLGGMANGLLHAGRWYNGIVAHAPWLWRLLYRWSNNRCGVWLGTVIMVTLWGRRLCGMIGNLQPDLVVSVHPLCVRLAAHALREKRSQTAHHCVVTDLVSIHRYWASVDVEVFYTATPRAAEALGRHGVPPERLRVTGLPLRHAFTGPPTPPSADPIPHVVLLDGGQATHSLERAVRALLATEEGLRLTVVCGGNDRLRRRLTWIASNRATVLGWSDDVAGLMRSASVVVTKAGSVTLAEAFSQARPVVVYHIIPGQEDGNITLLTVEGRGWYRPAAETLPAAVMRAHALAGTCRYPDATWWAGAAARVAACLAAAAMPVETRAQAPSPLDR